MAITEKTVSFLGENWLHDSWDWFNEHKSEYKELVETPVLALSRQLGETLNNIDSMIITEPRRTISRIWRDTRFSKDKTVFREVVWLAFHRGKGMAYPCFFFQFSPHMYSYGCGYYAAPTKVMEYVKQLVLADDKRYKAAQKVLDALPQFELVGEEYKRARYPDQPESKRNWLNRKNISVIRSCTDPALLFSEDLAVTLCDAFQKLAPVYELLLHAHLQLADKLPER